ncbi:hypothetical protein NKG94_09960 [Micromonospora sp. M12]
MERPDGPGGGRRALLLGLAILVAQLRRWTPVRLATDDREGWYLHRRCVERRLADAARAVPGVRRARSGSDAAVVSGAPGPRDRRPGGRAEIEFAVHQELHRLTAPAPAGSTSGCCPGGGRHDQRRAPAAVDRHRAAAGGGRRHGAGASLDRLPGTDPAATLLSADLMDRWRMAAPWSTLAAAVAGRFSP